MYADLGSHVVGAAHNVGEDLAWLIKHRQAKVCCFQRRIRALVCQQKVLRLQVSADNKV